jgi:tRNA G18 (ribose-2'-O)-methylase SpoU
VSLGGEDLVPWEYISQAESILQLKELKKEGLQIVSVEQSGDSVDYKKVHVKNRSIIILGNEVGGVSKEILKLSDVIAEIPLQGKKESLNVSVAAGVSLFRLLDR